MTSCTVFLYKFQNKLILVPKHKIEGQVRADMSPKMKKTPKNKDDPKNVVNLKNEDNFINTVNLKTEDSLKN